MTLMLRRLRGVLGFALLSGAAWGVVGAAYALSLSRHVSLVLRDGVPIPVPLWLIAVRGALPFAGWGVAAGAAFAGLLWLLGRRTREVSALRLPLVAAAGTAGAALAWAGFLMRLRGPWGAMPDMLGPVISSSYAGILGAGALGASVAVAAVLLARRARRARDCRGQRRRPRASSSASSRGARPPHRAAAF